jgi:hypothetical protein
MPLQRHAELSSFFGVLKLNCRNLNNMSSITQYTAIEYSEGYQGLISFCFHGLLKSKM